MNKIKFKEIINCLRFSDLIVKVFVDNRCYTIETNGLDDIFVFGIDDLVVTFPDLYVKSIQAKNDKLLITLSDK